MDVMQMIYQALCEDAELLEMLGGTDEKYWRIYNNPVAPNEKEFPRITMFEIMCEDDEWADDEPQAIRITVRIDIWTRKNTLYKIAKRVKSILFSRFLRCEVSLGSDMVEKYEKEARIYHKPIDVEIILRRKTFYE